MSSGFVLLFVFGIGFVCGLRSFTGPAVVAWAAHLGWIRLAGTPLAFMGSKWAVGIFTIVAIVELIADQLPNTPARTAPMGLSARIIMGLLTGACVAAPSSTSLIVGALTGAIGAIAGAFVGYRGRVGLVRSLRVPDIAIAIPEDLIAIALGLFIVTRL
jgi:uncharacterized membrane protein